VHTPFRTHAFTDTDTHTNTHTTHTHTHTHRLAMLPRGGDLVWGEGKYKSDWPLFLYGNVFVLPGVPQFFRSKLDTILHSFIPARKVFLFLFYFFRVSSRFRVLFIF
jgi:molybdopterin-biosynthesis enzyme MoeA-like protein